MYGWHNSLERQNVAGADCISRYDFALKIAEIFDLDKSMVTHVPNSYFTRIASRPYNTCFCTDKMEHGLEIKPTGVEEGLKILKYGIAK